MICIESLKAEIAKRLSGYKVYFSLSEIPSSIVLPSEWRNFGIVNNGSPWVPSAWRQFASELPWVTAWLAKCVVGTVFVVGSKNYLGYVYLENGRVYVYLGGQALTCAEMIGFDIFPPKLTEFYLDLHNGFGFSIGNTMGPSAVQDFIDIKDLCDEEAMDLPDMAAVFSSGAGDYLALGRGVNSGKSYIWWHEDPLKPEVNIEYWSVMDAWISIFLENSDSNEIL